MVKHNPGWCWLQVLTHADTAHFLGLIDLNQRVKAMQMQLEASQLIAQGGLRAHRALPPSALLQAEPGLLLMQAGLLLHPSGAR